MDEMLGVFRLVLASAVVLFHLAGMERFPWLGPLAVIGFYVISGFLITLVLNETYRFDLRRFVVNRALRLYPAYAVIALCALALSTTSRFAEFHPSWAEAARPVDYVANLFILPWSVLGDKYVPLDFTSFAFFDSATPHFRLVPSTWSVGVEMACYLLLWLFTARSLGTALITLFLGLLYHYAVSGAGHGPLYFPVPAAMVPFALGSIAYRLSTYARALPRDRDWFQLSMLASLTVLFLANWMMMAKSDAISFFYVQYGIMFAGMVLLGASKPSGLLRRVDRWCGDLAYPVFLGQYVFAYVAWLALGPEQYGIRGGRVFVLGFALTILASVLIVIFVDSPIAALRSRVRKSPAPDKQGSPEASPAPA